MSSCRTWNKNKGLSEESFELFEVNVNPKTVRIWCRFDLLTLVYCQISDVVAWTVYVVGCVKLGLFWILCCVENTKRCNVSEDILLFSSGSFLDTVLQIQILQRICTALKTSTWNWSSCGLYSPPARRRSLWRMRWMLLRKIFCRVNDMLLSRSHRYQPYIPS